MPPAGFRALGLPLQPFGQRRRQERLAHGLGDERILPGVADVVRAPLARHPRQHLVARRPRLRRLAVGPQPRRRLRQHGEQRRVGMAQAFGRLLPSTHVGMFEAPHFLLQRLPSQTALAIRDFIKNAARAQDTSLPAAAAKSFA
jgi:hypothetical protein